MSDTSRRSRTRGVLIVAAVVVVIAVVAVVGFVTAGGSSTRAASSPSTGAAGPTATSTPTAFPSGTASPTGSASPTRSATPRADAAPTPQATRTAAIAAPAPITPSVKAEVTKVEAVQGEAKGPGEIAGPAVRFTVTISNSTGRSLDLSDTVVNAYYGADATPADPLEQPGGRALPHRVAAGEAATGVFVFSVPKAERSKVQITVDTSTRNPVVAFTGRVP